MSRYIDVEPIIKAAREAGHVLCSIDLLEAVPEVTQTQLTDATDRHWNECWQIAQYDAENRALQAELEAAKADMEALMWHSGDGCTICAHAVKDTRVDYSKYDCSLGSTMECEPKWRGRKEME